jgi:protein-disulfide isomerase
MRKQMKLSIKSVLVMLCLTLFLTACSDASIPEEGKQYVSLEVPLKDKRLSPVTEVFSLTCGHCRNLEKYLPVISELSGTEFGRLHITFNRAADNMARLYYAAEMQLAKAPNHSFMEELFTAVRINNKTQREETITKLFASQDLLNPYKFNNQLNQQLMAKMNQVRRLSERSAIHAVPTFIINGRYRLLIKGHKNPQQIADTIKYLLNN